jgi:hypothetical protein
MSEISFESDADVEAALSAAALADETPPVEQAPAPVVETPPAGEVADPAATAEQPEPVVPAEDSPSLFDGTAVNPDELIAQHPELEPFVKQLTATFTRKTQGVAEQRKELEALGSVEDLQQAAQLYQRMSDPSNWPEIHARLTEALEEQGLTPAQASAEAARQMGAEQPSPGELPDDPELQPFVKELQAQRAELAQLRAERNAEVQQAAAERERQSMINELQAAETAIRQANDNYEQQDIDMVYKLAPSTRPTCTSRRPKWRSTSRAASPGTSRRSRRRRPWHRHRRTPPTRPRSRATNARSRTSRPSRPSTSAVSSRQAKSRSTASSSTPSDPPRERGLSTLDPRE